MKPTRNIVKPNTGMWTTKGKVWYQKNDDGKKAYSGEEIYKWAESHKNPETRMKIHRAALKSMRNKI